MNQDLQADSDEKGTSGDEGSSDEEEETKKKYDWRKHCKGAKQGLPPRKAIKKLICMELDA